jgi:hypothetical protein
MIAAGPKPPVLFPSRLPLLLAISADPLFFLSFVPSSFFFP